MNPRAMHFGAEEVDLASVVFTPELLACLPAHVAKRYRVLPVSDSGRVLRLALADPSHLAAMDTLTQLLRRELEWCVAEDGQLAEFITRLYGSEEGT